MTELPPPRPAGAGPLASPAPSSPPPPPPPPGIMARPSVPGDVATLRRIGSLARVVTALTGVAAALAVVSIWASRSAQDDARALLDGTITTQQFVERAAPYLLMSVVQSVVTGATAVVTIIWMFRIAKNHRALHRGGTWGPGWAIAGWLLPPLVFVIPTLMFRELWKASDPGTPVGADWRSNRASPLILLWFVLYSLLPLGLMVAQTTGGLSLSASERDMAQQVIDDQGLTVVSAAVTVAGAIAFVLLVRGLTERHRALTGESTA